MIKIGIVDDHQLFLKSLGLLITSIGQYDIVVEALNGKDLIKKLEISKTIPDILFIDVTMPVMDGPSTAAHINKYFPTIKAVALSMKDDDTTIIRMLRAGCCAYLLKDIHPDELERALLEIHSKGFYNADAFNVNYRRLILKANENEALSITARETEFLKLACSDLTYKEVAAQMFLSERTIDGYRESLFLKLNVKSRVGMALEAIRRNIVSL
jgi:DNA-binding NarL/FixJ family response regulator